MSSVCKFREIGLLLERLPRRALSEMVTSSPRRASQHGLPGHQQPALAAGVDNAGFFQHRVLIDRICARATLAASTAASWTNSK